MAELVRQRSASYSGDQRISATKAHAACADAATALDPPPSVLPVTTPLRLMPVNMAEPCLVTQGANPVRQYAR